MALSRRKTHILSSRNVKEPHPNGFDFLACHLRMVASWARLKRGEVRHFLHRWPSQRSMVSVYEKVRKKTGRDKLGVKDVRDIIDDLTRMLRGWGMYFRTGNAERKFRLVDDYVWRRLKRFMKARKGGRPRGAGIKWTREFFWDLGLHRLQGTVKYPS